MLLGFSLCLYRNCMNLLLYLVKFSPKLVIFIEVRNLIGGKVDSILLNY